MAVTLKESSRLIEEAQDREVQLLSTVKSLEQKVHSLTERDHEVSIQVQVQSLKRFPSQEKHKSVYIQGESVIGLFCAEQNMKKQRVAEAAVDTMQQQVMELGRSDTLSRAREKHDRDMSAVREKHEATLLGLQQQMDACSQALEEQVSAHRPWRSRLVLTGPGGAG